MMFFLKEYFRNPLQIGAVAPSSRWLAQKMLQEAGLSRCDCIVEYGPGTGVFTEEIIKRKRADAVFIAIEQNKGFSNLLARRYSGNPSVHIVRGSAKDVVRILARYGIPRADLIVSGLPFASLPRAVSEGVLAQTEAVLAEKGRFIAFQYTLLRRKLFSQRFRIARTLFEIRNIPPAFVFVMERKGGQT